MATFGDFTTIGKRVRYIREGRGLTLEEFARELHTKPEYLEDIEKGWGTPRIPRSDIFQTICSQYRISPDWLLNRKGTPYENLSAISERIMLYRHRKNLSRDAFAKKTGLSKELIRDIERGLTGPTKKELEDISVACDISVEWFTGEEDLWKQEKALEAEKEAKEMGARLARARKELGVTREEMAEAIGVSSTSIRAFEEDGQKPGRQFLMKISSGLGISYDWIVIGMESPIFDVKESEKIAEWLRSIRRKRGMTQDVFAEIMGISKEEIFLYENCANLPGVDFLKDVSELWEVPIVKCSLTEGLQMNNSAGGMGEGFAHAREALGVSREAIAEVVNISPEQIRKFEEEGEVLGQRALKMICREFGISYDYIMLGQGDAIFDKKTSKQIAEWLVCIRDRESVSREDFADMMGVSTEKLRCTSVASICLLWRLSKRPAHCLMCPSSSAA